MAVIEVASGTVAASSASVEGPGAVSSDQSVVQAQTPHWERQGREPQHTVSLTPRPDTSVQENTASVTAPGQNTTAGTSLPLTSLAIELPLEQNLGQSWAKSSWCLFPAVGGQSDS